VASACRLALESPHAAGEALNISSGVPMTVGEVACRTVRALGRPGLQPDITGRYRVGDIRHCFADISRAHQVLGWRPRVTLEQGLEDLAGWLEGQSAADRGPEARAELAARGLMV
jgi:dTDP-L-rhamnose 4-epimerase